MKFADGLVERTLFLERSPNLQDLGKSLIGENAPENLANDLTLQMDLHTRMQTSIAYCESIQDYLSRQLLGSRLEETEGHIDWIETEPRLIDSVGQENYLQLRSGASPLQHVIVPMRIGQSCSVEHHHGRICDVVTIQTSAAAAEQELPGPGPCRNTAAVHDPGIADILSARNRPECKQITLW